LSQTLVASIQLTGFDASKDPVVWGATPFAALGVFNGATVPLFVQRKREWARMPGAIADTRSAPFLARTSRGVYYAGGSSGGSNLLAITGYDLLALDNFGISCPGAATKSFALVILPQANLDGEIALAWRVDDAAVNVVGLGDCTDYSDVAAGLVSSKV